MLQSNNFDTSPWTGGSTIFTSGQSGYDGSNDAWLLTHPLSTNSTYQLNTNSGVQTFSIYAKSDGSTGIRLYAFGDANANAYFDLNNGVVRGPSNVINSDIVSVGNGWYRCSITFNQTNSTLRIYTTNNVTTPAAGSVYIQDAQLESGYFATPYIETTTEAVTRPNRHDTPRLDYSGTEPSLLLEPQRTNLVKYSEDYSNNLIDNITVSANNAISPEGVQNATLITEDTNTGLHRLREQSNITFTKDDSQYVISFFAKSNGRNIKYIDDGYAGSSTIVHFNLSTGQTSNEGSLIIDSNMEDYGNGWYRCSAVVNKASASQGLFRFTLRLLGGASNDTDSYTGDGTSGVWIYGKQAEDAVNYATSYIPTNGQAETRNLDLSTNSNISDFLPSTGYTIFFEVKSPPAFTGGTQAPLNFTSSTTDRISPYFYNGTLVTDIVANSVVRGALVLESSAVVNAIYKVAISVQDNNIRKSVNGSSTSLLNSDLVSPVLSALRLGSFNTTSNALGSTLGQIVLFPEALTDTELQQLTSNT